MTFVRAIPTKKPFAIDLFCGLGGWTEGLLAEGWRVRGYDIEAHEYGEEKYPAELVLADVLAINGADLADADLIVASPPCTEFSYMAMPWGRAKQIAQALRGEDEFPEGYKGSRTIAELTALFDACFRIQREASSAAGRQIPMVVENVKGAQPWVGRPAWNYGSYYLWGNVPALMPPTVAATKAPGLGHGWKHPDDPRHTPGLDFTRLAGKHAEAGVKVAALDGGRRTDKGKGARFTSRDCGVERDGIKQAGIGGMRVNGKGAAWFQDGAAQYGSKSPARKAASAKIAKIPMVLSRHIARTFLPHVSSEAA